MHLFYTKNLYFLQKIIKIIFLNVNVYIMRRPAKVYNSEQNADFIEGQLIERSKKSIEYEGQLLNVI
jgi:hypothetical protein